MAVAFASAAVSLPIAVYSVFHTFTPFRLYLLLAILGVGVLSLVAGVVVELIHQGDTTNL